MPHARASTASASKERGELSLRLTCAARLRSRSETRGNLGVGRPLPPARSVPAETIRAARLYKFNQCEYLRQLHGCQWNITAVIMAT